MRKTYLDVVIVEKRKAITANVLQVGDSAAYHKF
jgi:hypothetical protein